jgi:hypothetical protein
LSFNGSGVFVINTSGQPVVTGSVISSTAFNALTADLATGLSTTITKDGQSTPTANIPWGGFKITGLGTPTTTGDALAFGRTGTIDTLTLTNALTYGNGGTGLTSPGASGNVLTSTGSAWASRALPNNIIYSIIFGL